MAYPLELQGSVNQFIQSGQIGEISRPTLPYYTSPGISGTDIIHGTFCYFEIVGNQKTGKINGKAAAGSIPDGIAKFNLYVTSATLPTLAVPQGRNVEVVEKCAGLWIKPTTAAPLYKDSVWYNPTTQEIRTGTTGDEPQGFVDTGWIVNTPPAKDGDLTEIKKI
jgi:hypothetical protein